MLIRQSQRATAAKKTPGEILSSDAALKPQKSPVVKNEITAKTSPSHSSALYPAIKTSTIDVDARPIYEPNDKPITEIDLDAGMSSIADKCVDRYSRMHD